MQRLLAILVAGAVATTSVAGAAEPCPTMRAQALKRCCCPPSPQGHARLTCCDSTRARHVEAAVRDRHEQPQVATAAAAGLRSCVSLAASPFIASLAHAPVASAAGPPLVPLRI